MIGEIFKRIGAEVKVKEVRTMRTGREEWEEMAVVKLETEEGKREVMRRKKGLRGGTVWLEDLTWRERRSRWRFREAVKVEEKKGAKIWMGMNKAMGSDGSGMRRRRGRKGKGVSRRRGERSTGGTEEEGMSREGREGQGRGKIY